MASHFYLLLEQYYLHQLSPTPFGIKMLSSRDDYIKKNEDRRDDRTVFF